MPSVVQCGDGGGPRGVDGDEKGRARNGEVGRSYPEPRARAALPKRLPSSYTSSFWPRDIARAPRSPNSPFPFLRRMARGPPKTLKNKALAATATQRPRPDWLIPVFSRFSVLRSTQRVGRPKTARNVMENREEWDTRTAGTHREKRGI